MTRRTSDNAKAIDAFLAAKAEIDAMLERLTALSADHFETSPDEIKWGHVGTLNHYRDHLREITDSAFKEGELNVTSERVEERGGGLRPALSEAPLDAHRNLHYIRT